MKSEFDRAPCLDRHAQIEFGRFFRERLGNEPRAEMPSELDALLATLRAVDEDESREER